MPKVKHVEMRYQILNKCFRNRYREYTLEDLINECNKVLRANDRPEVSKRTIQHDIEELQCAPYYIRLDENLKRGKQRLYRYVDTDYTLPQFHINDEERNKIEDAIYVLERYEGDPLFDWVRALLMEVEGGMLDEDSSPVVSFQNNPDLKGLHHFKKLLKAITTKRVLKLSYTPFGKDTMTINVYPYHLKQYNDRWYLIARPVDYEKCGNFPLDRIEDFKEVAIPYKESDIDFDEYFDDVIGVTVPNGEPIDITLKVSKESVGYVLTKPLHLSQRVMVETDDYTIISINVKPNYELDSKILSFGPNMEVLSPESYRTHLQEKIKAMNEKYINNAENLHT